MAPDVDGKQVKHVPPTYTMLGSSCRERGANGETMREERREEAEEEEEDEAYQ